MSTEFKMASRREELSFPSFTQFPVTPRQEPRTQQAALRGFFIP